VSTADTALDVFIPFWGDPDLLYATVESVRAQTDPRWRATIVDDCYPDPSVAEHFAVEDDPRITYVRNDENLGITANYDKCRALATADLMMFLGCDDLLLPDFVATVLADHARFPEAAIIQPGVRVIDDAGRPTDTLADRVKRAIRPRAEEATAYGGEPLVTSLLHGDWLYWPSLVFRTPVVRGPAFRDDLPIIQDLALVIDLVVDGATLVLDPTVVFSYRRHTQSASSTSLLTGRRLRDERRYYGLAARQMDALGWRRARRAARLRWTSRLHGLSLLPAALGTRKAAAVRTVVGHAVAVGD
jgi:GT2 family glycosyltransferase